MCLSHRPYNPMLPAKDYTNTAFKNISHFQKENWILLLPRCTKTWNVGEGGALELPHTPGPPAGRWCCRSRSCCCTITAQHPQVPFMGYASLSLCSAANNCCITGVNSYSWFLIFTRPKFQLSKNSSNHKGRSLGFRNITIRWLKKTKEIIWNRRTLNRHASSTKRIAVNLQRGHATLFFQGKKATTLCHEMSF